MARPRKNRHRSEKIAIYLTKKEREKGLEVAEEESLSLSSLVRSLGKSYAKDRFWIEQTKIRKVPVMRGDRLPFIVYVYPEEKVALQVFCGRHGWSLSAYLRLLLVKFCHRELAMYPSTVRFG